MFEPSIPSYEKLLEKTKNLISLHSAAALLRWDMETMMPPKGIKIRSLQLAMLRRITHKLGTDPEIQHLIEKTKNHPDNDKLDLIDQRNLYLIQKNYDEQTQLPENLVVEISKQEALTINIWKKAKASKNYPKFKPEL
ncbi:MAG: hypothetical protein P8X91_05255 [Candidatus Bathyarchaeota archaeon]